VEVFNKLIRFTAPVHFYYLDRSSKGHTTRYIITAVCCVVAGILNLSCLITFHSTNEAAISNYFVDNERVQGRHCGSCLAFLVSLSTNQTFHVGRLALSAGLVWRIHNYLKTPSRSISLRLMATHRTCSLLEELVGCRVSSFLGTADVISTLPLRSTTVLTYGH